jgi:hypothetical protein
MFEKNFDNYHNFLLYLKDSYKNKAVILKETNDEVHLLKNEDQSKIIFRHTKEATEFLKEKVGEEFQFFSVLRKTEKVNSFDVYFTVNNKRFNMIFSDQMLNEKGFYSIALSVFTDDNRISFRSVDFKVNEKEENEMYKVLIEFEKLARDMKEFRLVQLCQ